MPSLKISACMIAKHERENIRPCLESLWPHVDQVCLSLDSRSRDGTGRRRDGSHASAGSRTGL